MWDRNTSLRVHTLATTNLLLTLQAVEYLNSSEAETAASDLVQNSSKQLASLHRTSQSGVVRNLLSKLGDPSLEARIGAGVQVSSAIYMY
jgi:hypothetical protein